MKKALIALATLSAASLASAQVTILLEDFETDGQGTRYTASTPFLGGTSDHWTRTDGLDISASYSGASGTYFWAAEDTDDSSGNTNDEQTIVFSGLNILGMSTIDISGLFAAGNTGGAGASAYDASDYVKVTFSVDGGVDQDALWFSYVDNGDAFNEPLAFDSDFDGIGDSTILDNTFAEFSANSIGVSGTTLDLKISVHMDSANEEIAFDSIMVTGYDDSISGVPEPSALGLLVGLAAMAGMVRRRR